jgi:hypothetical protein
VDDITLFGSPLETAACFNELRDGLATMGLRVNAAKTRTYSQRTQMAADAAEYLGIQHARDGLPILGAFVSGNHEWIRQQLIEKANSYDTYFQNLAQLPAPVAFPMLQSCIVSKWVYIARTHSPAVAKEAHFLFDSKVRLAFKLITGVESDLNAESYYAMHLPMREGGLGLPSYELIGGLAYTASRNDNVGGTQEMLTIAHDHTVIALLQARPGWADWLAAQRKDGSSLWIRGCRQINNTPGYASALLLRIRAFDVASPSAVCPHCKVQQEGFLMLSHILGCARQKGIGPATRHSAVLTEVIAGARTAGLPAIRELALTTANKRADGSDLRMDAVIETERKMFYVDVTIRSTTAKSFTEAKAEKDKKKLYHSAATEAKADLVVFAVDALGGFSKAANSICKIITTGSCQTYDQLRTDIAWRIAMHNGLMHLKWRKVQYAPAPAPTPPIAAASSDLCPEAAAESDDEEDAA